LVNPRHAKPGNAFTVYVLQEQHQMNKAPCLEAPFESASYRLQEVGKPCSAPRVRQFGARLALISAWSPAAKVVVPVRERSPAADDVTIRVATNGFELPYTAGQLQVSYMLTLV
jgi:hypothetical protein